MSTNFSMIWLCVRMRVPHCFFLLSFSSVYAFHSWCAVVSRFKTSNRTWGNPLRNNMEMKALRYVIVLMKRGYFCCMHIVNNFVEYVPFLKSSESEKRWAQLPCLLSITHTPHAKQTQISQKLCILWSLVKQLWWYEWFYEIFPILFF